MNKFIILLIWGLALTFITCVKESDSTEYGKKAQWILDFFHELDNYQDIYAVSYWHENFDNTYFRLDSSPDATEAYKISVQNEQYISQAVFSGGKLLPVNQKKYLAAFPDLCGEEDCVRIDSIQKYELLTGKAITWVYFSNNWTDGIHFPLENVNTILSLNKVPYIRIMPRSDFEIEGIDPEWNLTDIIDGNYDTALLQWFTDAKNTNTTLLMEFGTEMNGKWFSWNGLYYGAGETSAYGDPNYPDGPEIFRDAYRHLIDLSIQAGADNITWFFHFDVNNDPEEEWNDPVYYYPGDEYIDWLGVSTYGAYSPDEDSEELTPEFLLQKAHDKFMSISTNKPYAVLEFGVTELP